MYQSVSWWASALRSFRQAHPGRDRDHRKSPNRLFGKPKRVITLPNWLLKPAMAAVEFGYRLRGKQSGLSMVPFVDLQTRNAFLDTDYSREQLGYEKGDLDKALEDTVRACLLKSS